MVAALSIVDGRKVDRDLFLKSRDLGIGGSDAAAVLNLSPYKTPTELYMEKTGQVAPNDLSTNMAVRMGIRLEPIIREEFEAETGKKVICDESLFVHPEHKHVIAHVDGFIGHDAGFEAKSVGARSDNGQWGGPGTDLVPEHYLLQCQHYMAVTGRSTWYLAAFFLGRLEQVVYVIHRDDDLISMMLDEYATFWNCVEKRITPPLDLGSPTALAFIRKVYPGTNGATITLTQEAEAWHLKMVEAKTAVQEANAVIDDAKLHILTEMGESAVGKLSNGLGAYTRKVIKKKPYTVTPSPYVDFRHVKKA
jgi:putative phage-type endonuclease